MNETPKQCPKCGAPIPAEAPQGLCPKCLMAQASTPTETIEIDLARPTPPSLAEVAAAFPQLEILELIGQGGMGFVYKARQPKLERFVALKILPQSSTADPRFAERFTREGRLLARLSHPNIVIIHDFGQAGGFFYLLMEYVDGANLRQAMRAGRFTPEQALAIVPKICDALQFAHNEGILHRDIKPENILLDSKGRVKIADFGIAKLIGEPQAEAHLTGTGGTLGTPHYMAPEQVERPASVDHRADIYSLGVVFYEMLTGELPLGRFQPPSQKVRVDVRLDDVVLHALEKEPSRRYQHASEVRTAVDTITANTGGAASPPPPPSATLAARPIRGRAIKAGFAVFLLTGLAATLFASNLTGAHVRGSLALGILSGVVTGGLTAIFVGLFSA
ncbi:MAG TPA: serine/threonine-protein kinase, partial [Candidatus Dormibacteraeota bacterium]|nr:serine/threonine-protein kinase [Candidatus Dormibacteraeota bacterium]